MSFIFTTSYFFWGTILLFVSTLVFYIVFFAFLYYWHETKATFIVVPLLHTFEFFAIAFLVISFICIFLQYAPDITRLIIAQ